MSRKEKSKDSIQKKDTRELELEMLEDVSGGSNPFASIKRVKTHDIDEELREKI